MERTSSTSCFRTKGTDSPDRRTICGTTPPWRRSWPSTWAAAVSRRPPVRTWHNSRSEMDIPRDFNAATWFVDRHVGEGRAKRVAVVAEELAPAIEEVRPRLRFLPQLVVAGRAGPGQVGLAELVAEEPADLDAAATTKDDIAFWLYTSGTTGTPKAAVHLQHDMV